MRISALLRAFSLPEYQGKDFDIRGFGDFVTNIPDSIGYVADAAVADRVLENENLGFVLVPEGMAPRARCWSCKNPRELFFTLYDHWVKRAIQHCKSHVNPDATVDDSAIVAGEGVTVGRSVEIGAFAVVFPGVTIGDHVRIGAGCVIGGESLFVEKIQGRMQVVKPDLGVEIQEGSSLGGHVVVDAGMLGHRTVIGPENFLAANVVISHGVSLGRGNLISAGAVFGGQTTVGHGNFFGLNASITHRCSIGNGNFIAMRARVTRPIGDNARWLR